MYTPLRYIDIASRSDIIFTEELLKKVLTLNVTREPAHELPVHPKSEYRLPCHHRKTHERHRQIGEGNVDQEEILSPLHVLVPKHNVDDQRISGEGEQKRGNVEDEECDGGGLGDGVHVIHIMLHQVEGFLITEVVCGHGWVFGEVDQL